MRKPWPQPASIDSLSIEMLSEIFSKLSIQELVAPINVCRLWRQALTNDIRYENTKGRVSDIRRVWEKKPEGDEREIRSFGEVMAQLQIGHAVRIERGDLCRTHHFGPHPIAIKMLYPYGFDRPATGVCVIRKF